MADPNNTTINATPTKDFFISMLIKDIGTTRAIIDLVDNCVDGARRLRPSGNYTGLTIDIQIAKDYFQISDNCGGMSLDLARKYAFRFGRPAKMAATPYSIGQFGVGMKRALFKLGKKFRVESATRTSRFVIEEDVEKWKEKEEWEFDFKELTLLTNRAPLSETGTTIKVSPLHPTIAESFSLEAFRARLAIELAEAHAQNTAKGLGIAFNGTALHHHKLVLLQSERLKPAHRRSIFRAEKRRIDVRLYAGISESDPSAAGWYVFCNGRLVLSADQTNVTGWGETRGETVPKYHNQFARFRGYAFFDSRDASLLPWNTTKTGVDSDSPRYRATRLEMVKLTRPVIDFLNRLDAEKGPEITDDKPLESAVKAAKLTELKDIVPRPVFLAPKQAIVKTEPQVGRIQYWKPLKEIRSVQKALRVRTLTAVGLKTFDYFHKRECES
jgi:hypothetical protein